MDNHENSQIGTPKWKKQARDYYDDLDEVHQFIVDCRLKYLPYRYIVEEIKSIYKITYNENSIRHMMAEGGMCYKAFVYMEKQRIIDRHTSMDKIQEQLEEGKLAALEVLRKRIEKDDPQAAQDWLDRAGLPKNSKVENSGSLNVHHGIAQDIKSILEK